MGNKINIRTWIITATVGAMVLSAGAVFAESSPVNARGDKQSVTLYGQVNRALLYVDDGDKGKAYHVDNDASSTRIGMKAKSKVGDEFTAGAKIEVQIESNSTGSVNRDMPKDEDAATFTERHMDLFLQSDKMGKLSIGQGDTASNGSSEVDLSGTSLAGYSDIDTFAGGQLWYDKDADEVSGVKVKDVYSNFDGLSRKDRVRYDTPKLAGFVLSGSAVEGEAWDVAGRYGNTFGDTQLKAALAYAYLGPSKKTTQISGSISALMGMGLNLTFQYGSQDIDDSDKDPVSYYGKLGYKTKFTDLGDTAISIDYGIHDDIKNLDDEATTMGVQLVQKLKPYGTELYVGYRWHDLDREDEDFESLSGLMAGGRVKF